MHSNYRHLSAEAAAAASRSGSAAGQPRLVTSFNGLPASGRDNCDAIGSLRMRNSPSKLYAASGQVCATAVGLPTIVQQSRRGACRDQAGGVAQDSAAGTRREPNQSQGVTSCSASERLRRADQPAASQRQVYGAECCTSPREFNSIARQGARQQAHNNSNNNNNSSVDDSNLHLAATKQQVGRLQPHQREDEQDDFGRAISRGDQLCFENNYVNQLRLNQFKVFEAKRCNSSGGNFANGQANSCGRPSLGQMQQQPNVSNRPKLRETSCQQVQQEGATTTLLFGNKNSKQQQAPTGLPMASSSTKLGQTTSCNNKLAAELRQPTAGSEIRPLHVNFNRSSQTRQDDFGDEDCGNHSKKKYLTAKYGQQQMNLIKKRLKVEMWLHEQLQDLAKGSKSEDDLAEIDIDLDQLLDMDDDHTRRRWLKRTLEPFDDLPQDKIDKFICDVLEQSRLL